MVTLVWIPLLVRVLALVFATISTLGLISFFFFESLYPYRWIMLIGGSVGCFIFGWIGDRISPTREAVAAIDSDELLRSAMADDEDDDHAAR